VAHCALIIREISRAGPYFLSRCDTRKLAEHNTSFRRLSRPDVACALLSVDFREFMHGEVVDRTAQARQREEGCLFTDGEMLSDYRIHATRAIATATNRTLSVDMCISVGMCVCARSYEYALYRNRSAVTHIVTVA